MEGVEGGAEKKGGGSCPLRFKQNNMQNVKKLKRQGGAPRFRREIGTQVLRRRKFANF